MSEYSVKIKKKMKDDDGWAACVGSCTIGQCWWELPLPPCPDCGGEIIWWEAGFTPGTRKCAGKNSGTKDARDGCGSMFQLDPEGEHATWFLRRARFY